MAFLASGLLVVGALACFKDPVESLQGSASRVSLSRKFLQQNVGDTTVVNIQVLDAQGNPLTLTGVTYTSLDPTVSTMEALPDSSLRNFPGVTLTKAIVIAKNVGTTKIVVTGNGLNDTITTISYPTSFTGTTAPAVIHVGDTITVTAPALTTFGSTATVSYTSGALGFPVAVVSRTASTLKFVPTESMATPGHYRLSGGILLGTIALPALTSAATINVLPASNEPANDASAGAGNMGTIAAANDSLVAWGEMDGNEPTNADYWKFTMNATGTISVQLSFSGTGSGTGTNPDMDVVVCTTLSAAGNCGYGQDIIPGNGASATNQPETGTTPSIAAGTTVYVRVYYYDPASPQRTGYRLRVKTP